MIWSGLNEIQCMKASCSMSEEIKKYLIAYNDTHFVGQTVSYTCPNGIIRSASCNWDSDSKTANWAYKGNCSGVHAIFDSQKNVPLLENHFLMLVQCCFSDVLM